MVSCCVAGCGNRSSRKTASQAQREQCLGKPITFHRFTDDLTLKDKWLQAIQKPDFAVSPKHRICSEHFAEEDFCFGKKRKILKDTACPTLLLVPTDLRKSFSVHYVSQNRRLLAPYNPTIQRKKGNVYSTDKSKEVNAPDDSDEDSPFETLPVSVILEEKEESVQDSNSAMFRAVRKSGVQNISPKPSPKPVGYLTKLVPISPAIVTSSLGSQMNVSARNGSMISVPSASMPAVNVSTSSVPTIVLPVNSLPATSVSVIRVPATNSPPKRAIARMLPSVGATKAKLPPLKPAVPVGTQEVTSLSSKELEVSQTLSSLQSNAKVISGKSTPVTVTYRLLASNPSSSKSASVSNLASSSKSVSLSNSASSSNLASPPSSHLIKEHIKEQTRLQELLERTRVKCKRLNKKNKTLQQAVRRDKLRIEHLKRELKNLRKIDSISSEDFESLKSLGGIHEEFLQRQIQRAKGLKIKRKFGPELISFARKLHYFSPRAYDFVRKKFGGCLPHPKTLNRTKSPSGSKPEMSESPSEILVVDVPVVDSSKVCEEMTVIDTWMPDST